MSFVGILYVISISQHCGEIYYYRYLFRIAGLRGNTGIGMVMIATAMGYGIKLTMSACISEERRSILHTLVAELELTPGCDKIHGAIKKANNIMGTNGDLYFMPN